jgi:hypothetical protein
LKQTINIGTYGWRHPHWTGSFYPDDLPQGWQLTYYSNVFNAVMVPADYWSDGSAADAGQWLDNVHEKFQFYVQCDEQMIDDLTLQASVARLSMIQPQLAALVYLGDEKELGESRIAGFESLSRSLDCDLLGINRASGGKAVWRQGGPVTATSSTNFAYLESELTDLRAVRAVFDEFIQQLDSDDHPATLSGPGRPQLHSEESGEACIIVDHPRLRAEDVSAARAVLEIMGH